MDPVQLSERKGSTNEYNEDKLALNDARLATSKEHKLTVLQSLKPYRKAIGWSVMLSAAVIMEGRSHPSKHVRIITKPLRL
jgi:SP family general alpha glucoside:H+ symporter-like MFS transporter